MLGVKLTVLGIVVLLMLIFITRFSVNLMSEVDKMKLGLLNIGPNWYNVLCILIGFLAAADIIGLLYSVVWLLFFR